MTFGKEEDITMANETLLNFGINVFDENGLYRPFNEVLTDIADMLIAKREPCLKGEDDFKSYVIQKKYLFERLVGIRRESVFLEGL